MLVCLIPWRLMQMSRVLWGMPYCLSLRGFLYSKGILKMFFSRLWQSMPSTISLGLLWGVMTLGVFLTYRLLSFSDLTVDGSFAFGGAVAARLVTMGADPAMVALMNAPETAAWLRILLTAVTNPLMATLIAFLAGMLAGACTGLLHTRLRIPDILASILTQIGLYSVNLHVMGKANLPFPTVIANGTKSYRTVFSMFAIGTLSDKLTILVYGVVIVILVIMALWWFLNTEQGISLRATGDNAQMSRAMGINTNNMKLLCLMLANGLVAMSGALIAQNNRVSTLDMGTGSIVFGLAAIIIGDVLLRPKSLLGKLGSVIVGSIIYRIIQTVVLLLNWPAEDFKLLSAVIIAVALSLPVIKEKMTPIMIRFGLMKEMNLDAMLSAQADKDEKQLADDGQDDEIVRKPDGDTAVIINKVRKSFNIGTINQKNALCGVDFKLAPGDFVTVIGGNGAGKSTMLNSVAGVYPINSGDISIGPYSVSGEPEHKRARLIGRVFQDPMLGTAAGMTIEENLSIAYRRGKKRGLRPSITKGERAIFKELLKPLDLGLENRLKSRVGLLSGGQRQALTLLMATLTRPQLLLLDEHTAALDPKTAKNVLVLTERIVRKEGLTAMMVTHNMRDALQYGNRIIMMHEGRIILDIDAKTKRRIKVEDLLAMFEHASGDALNNDRMLLS